MLISKHHVLVQHQINNDISVETREDSSESHEFFSTQEMIDAIIVDINTL
jgi:hypothetical protein